MSALLYLPGVLVVLFRRRGLSFTLLATVALALSQIVIGWPFLKDHPRHYLKFAFEFSRQFLYKWTVNWRFISEDIFLSSVWARTLLFLHLTTLVAFGFRWCRRDGGVFSVLRRGLQKPTVSPSLVPLSADCKFHTLYYIVECSVLYPSSTDVTTVLFTSNLVGIVFARSLHYQFFSWYATQIPYLLWRTQYPTLVK